MNINFYGSTTTLDRVCRICLTEAENLSSIFIQPPPEADEPSYLSLPQKLKIYGGIEISEHGNLPTLICDICCYKANVAHEFRQQCQNSDERLRLYYHKPSRLNSSESGTQTDPQVHITFHKNTDNQTDYYVKQELQNINNTTMNNQTIDTIVYQQQQQQQQAEQQRLIPVVEHHHHHLNNHHLNNHNNHHQQQQQHHQQQQQHHHQQQLQEQIEQGAIIENNIIDTNDKIYLCQIGYDNSPKELNKNTLLIESTNIDDNTNCIQNNTQIIIATDGNCEQRIHAVVDETLLQSSNNKNNDEYFNGHILVTADGVVVAKPSETNENQVINQIENNNENINDNDNDIVDDNNDDDDDDGDDDINNSDQICNSPETIIPGEEIRQPTMRAAKSSGKSYNDNDNDFDDDVDDDEDDDDNDDDYQGLNDIEKPTYYCKVCQKKYTSLKRLKNHTQTHEKKYKCKICARLFYKYDNLIKHEKIHVTKPHACQECHTSFTKPQSLERHLKSHKLKYQSILNIKKTNNNIKNENNQSDNDNNNGDSDDDNDNLHMAIDDEFNKPPGCFKCTQCGQLCTTLKSLKRHSLLHGDKKYSCTVCEKWFHRPDTLKKHAEKNGHGLLDNLIDDNKLFDSSDDDYPSHSSTSTSTSTTTTSTSTSTTPLTTIKIKNNNSSDNDNNNDDEGGGGRDDDDDCGEYKCQHCDKIMTSKKGLIRHVSMHKPKAEPATCGICNKICASQARLAIHQKTHNKPKDKIPREYLCHVCSKVYPSNSSLTYHMRTHSGIKPHCCKICNSRFTTTTSLANHTRIHTGDKPFVCHVCSAAFAVSSAFRRHLTRHTGEANYLCKTCGKRFKRLSTLKEHTYTHSGEKPYACKNCGVAYSHSGSLFAHQKRCKIQYDVNNEQHNNHNNIVHNQNQIHVTHHIHVNNVPSAVRSLGVIGPMF